MCAQYSNSSPAATASGMQGARVRPEPGEQRQLVAAHEHVHRVDLDEADLVEHPSQVSTVDAAGRARLGKALGGEGRAARRIRRQATRLVGGHRAIEVTTSGYTVG